MPDISEKIPFDKKKYQSEWQKKNRDKRNAACRRWYKKHRKEILAINKPRLKAWRDAVRAEVLEKFGGKCACCGETEESFLSLDHIDNTGAEDRRKSGRHDIYVWLKRQGFPKENLQLLCMNCQFGKKKLGMCPHQNKEALPQ